MKILSASLIATATGFLHAGYLSAYARTASPFRGDTKGMLDPMVQLDVVEALRLKSDAAQSAVDTASAGHISSWFSSLGSFPTLLAGVLGVFGLLGLLYLMRERWRYKPVTVRLSPVILVLIAVLAMFVWNEFVPRAKAADVQLKQYADPEAATFAIMHGILGPAIENGNYQSPNLKSVHSEIGLPTKTLTPGMRYALEHYTHDGWGRAFKVMKDVDHPTDIRLTSAGADGEFNTDDDIFARLYVRTDESFDRPSALFISKVGGDYFLFFHRFKGKLFEYYNREKAIELTGGELFDCLTDWKPTHKKSITIIAYFEKSFAALEKGKTHTPLMLHVKGSIVNNEAFDD